MKKLYELHRAGQATTWLGSVLSEVLTAGLDKSVEERLEKLESKKEGDTEWHNLSMEKQILKRLERLEQAYKQTLTTHYQHTQMPEDKPIECPHVNIIEYSDGTRGCAVCHQKWNDKPSEPMATYSEHGVEIGKPSEFISLPRCDAELFYRTYKTLGIGSSTNRMWELVKTALNR